MPVRCFMLATCAAKTRRVMRAAYQPRRSTFGWRDEARITPTATVKKISSHVASCLVFAGHLEIPS